VAEVEGSPYELNASTFNAVTFRDGFESDVGWTLEGEWEIGEPQGLGGSTGLADPTGAYNNLGVLGHDLSGQGGYGGDYEPGIAEAAYSPSLDATSWTNTKLVFSRRLNTHAGDEASIILWVGVGRPFYNSDGTVSESSFGVHSSDVGLAVDGQPSVQLQFRQSADESTQYSGWNIDDIIFKDGTLPDFAACRNCSAGPSFAGAISAVDNDACGQAGVTVSWSQPVSWGSGESGSFAVYRDTIPGFTPSGSNLVASGLSGSSFVDGTAPVGQTSYYLVRAENDESCGAGPANGGLTDDNTIYASALNTDDRPLPGAVTDLAVSLANAAHVRLEWSAPSDTAFYRLYRSTESTPGGFLLLGETEATFYDDESVGANANSYYYLVHAANACGQEGP
jgi:hypothetical protein